MSTKGEYYADAIDWNQYASGFDARLRGDPINQDQSPDWKLGWTDCDTEIQCDTGCRESENDSQG